MGVGGIEVLPRNEIRVECPERFREPSRDELLVDPRRQLSHAGTLRTVRVSRIRMGETNKERWQGDRPTTRAGLLMRAGGASSGRRGGDWRSSVGYGRLWERHCSSHRPGSRHMPLAV